MRLWSIHPCYLDTKGLVALWREGLLAQAVLAGKTKGYRSHPQLSRFRQHADPLAAISAYLWGVAEEASSRGYRFDTSKIARRRSAVDDVRLAVTDEQLRFEASHLYRKLEKRCSGHERADLGRGTLEPHPVFRVVSGPIEEWEVAYWYGKKNGSNKPGNRGQERQSGTSRVEVGPN